MKKLFTAILAIFLFAGTSLAIDYDFSGMINTRGTYLDNDDGLQEDSVDYMFYDMEFDADFKITPSDKTLIFLNMEIHDENFDQTPQDSQEKTGDDNIAFKRAYGKYTFDNGMSTTFGLMSGQAFGTAFADSGDGAYRWRIDGLTGFGAWGVVLGKNEELGTEGNSDWDAEKDDSDAYYAYWVGKFGNVYPMVLAGYINYGDVTGGAVQGGLEFEDSDMDLIILQIAVISSAGEIGYEGEFDYYDFSQNWNGGEDYCLWGVYANIWVTMDAVKMGGYVAYGSWNNDVGAGLNMGADFYFGEGVGESQAFGTNNNGAFAAVALLGFYGDYSVNDALSLDANFSYFLSNEDELANGEDSPYKDSGGFELTGRVSYKPADNVDYSVGAAYGEFTPDKGSSPDPYVRAYHKIQINF